MSKMKKIRILILSFSYFFFAFILFLSFNAVIPNSDLPIIETKKPMIIKIENDFLNDKDSIYEILNEDSKIKKNKVNDINFSYGKEELVSKIEVLSDNIEKESNLKYSIQFMSFNNTKTSLSATKILEEKLRADNFNLKLTVKPKLINGTKFFRVQTSQSFSFNNGKSLCDKLKKRKYECILVKL